MSNYYIPEKEMKISNIGKKDERGKKYRKHLNS